MVLRDKEWRETEKKYWNNNFRDSYSMWRLTLVVGSLRRELMIPTIKIYRFSGKHVCAQIHQNGLYAARLSECTLSLIKIANISALLQSNFFTQTTHESVYNFARSQQLLFPALQKKTLFFFVGSQLNTKKRDFASFFST